MHYIIEGSLEVKLPTIWTDQKAEMGRVREEERREEKRREEKKEERRKKKEEKKKGQKTERIRRKKMQARETVDKSRNTVFCQCFVAPEGRKV